jgi:hypothetical protein
MEPSKFIDFLHTYPIWFRLAVVFWVFLTAVVISGLLVVTRVSQAALSSENATLLDSAPAVQQSVQPASTHASPSRASDSFPSFESLDDYISKRAKLDGRFVQLEQFDKSALGTKVKWRGSVYSASGLSDDSSGLSLTVDALGESRDYFFVSAPRELRTFVSSLRKEDKVIVQGTITSSEKHPRVAATSIELM